MFGRDALPSRVYAYGARLDRESVPRALDQLRAARRYRNALVALERDRRTRAHEAICAYAPWLVAAEARLAEISAEITTIRDTVKRANSGARRRAPDPASRAAIAALTAERRTITGTHSADDPACACLRCRRRALYHEGGAIRAALDGVDAWHRAARLRLRAEYSALVSWGTRGQVEAGLSDIGRGTPPQFVGSQWLGKLAVQLQADTARDRPSPTWAALVAGDSHGTVCRVTPFPLPSTATATGRRSQRPHWRLSIRVGSDEDRAPVWVHARITLHRPIPDDAQIKWVYLVPTRRGSHLDWTAQFVCARPAWPVPADTALATGTAGVDLGWRRLDDGSLRVGYIAGEDGQHEAVTLPAALVARWRKADELRAIRDREFDLARAALGQWLAVQPVVPAWLTEAAATLAQWRSPGRLFALYRDWHARPAADRIAGDAEILARLERWRAQDRHLWDWEGANRLKAVRARREIYRRLAARLRWVYTTLHVEDTDWRELRKREAPEVAETPERLNRRWEQAVASPGLLRAALAHGHPSVRRVSAVDTTRRCSVCGADPAPDWDAAVEVVYRCAAGHRVDQDRNAAVNLLRASGEVVADAAGELDVES